MMRSCLLLTATLAASMPAADWLTFAGDAQRTGWARGETKLTKDNVKDLKLEWSLKLDNQYRELTSLTVPIIVENLITPRGFKDLVVVAGASNTLFAIDADTGKLFWSRTFNEEGKPKRTPHWLCPNALNATPIIDKRARTVYLITSDGRLHTLNVVNGEDRVAPMQFVPEFSKNWSLNLVNGLLYTTISQGCNGAKSGVYAVDLNDAKRPVSSFLSTTTGGAGIWGRAGVAVTSTGVAFAETGDGPYDTTSGKYSDTFLALSPKELKLADYYTPANRAWITKKDLDMGNMSPIVFKFQNRELVAGAGKEGVIYLLDAQSPGGADKRTPLYRSLLLTNEEVDFAGRGFWGAMSTWEDDAGTRWLYAPAWGPPASTAPPFPKSHGATPNGSVMAFRVVTKDGKPVLEAAWNSRDMNVPEPVVIANGVVFSVSSGENVRQVDSGGRLYSSPERINAPAGNAILYGLDAGTGQELFSSGKTMPGFTHFGGVAVASGRVYVTTHDSMLYAFGLGADQ